MLTHGTIRQVKTSSLHKTCSRLPWGGTRLRGGHPPTPLVSGLLTVCRTENFPAPFPSTQEYLGRVPRKFFANVPRGRVWVPWTACPATLRQSISRRWSKLACPLHCARMVQSWGAFPPVFPLSGSSAILQRKCILL